MKKLKAWWKRFWCQHDRTEFDRFECIPAPYAGPGAVRVVDIYRCADCGWEFI